MSNSLGLRRVDQHVSFPFVYRILLTDFIGGSQRIGPEVGGRGIEILIPRLDPYLIIGTG